MVLEVWGGHSGEFDTEVKIKSCGEALAQGTRVTFGHVQRQLKLKNFDLDHLQRGLPSPSSLWEEQRIHREINILL